MRSSETHGGDDVGIWATGKLFYFSRFKRVITRDFDVLLVSLDSL
jgi:hypothetical protein